MNKIYQILLILHYILSLQTRHIVHGTTSKILGKNRLRQRRKPLRSTLRFSLRIGGTRPPLKHRLRIPHRPQNPNRISKRFQRWKTRNPRFPQLRRPVRPAPPQQVLK